MSTVKCPNCKASLNETATVCEWCNFVINRDGQESVQSIANEILSLLKKMDAIPKPGILFSIKRNARISMPVFALMSFILAYKLSWLFSLLGCFFIWIAWRNRNNNASDENQNLMTNLSADYQLLMNKIAQLYGSNSDVSKQIIEFKKEFKRIADGFNQSKKSQWLGYLLIGTLLVVAFLIPTEKTSEEKNAEIRSNESELVNQMKDKIQQGQLDWVKSKLTEVKSKENIVTIQSLLQAASYDQSLEAANDLVSKGDFQNANKILSKLHWQKNADEYELEQIEEPFFKNFVAQKNSIIEKMPTNWQPAKEDEFAY